MSEPSPAKAVRSDSPSAPGAAAAPRSRGAFRRRLRRALPWLVGGALFATLCGAGATALIVNHYAEGLPSIEHLREGGYNPPQVSRILAADGTLLFADFVQRRTVVPFESIADVTKLAFMAAEDAFFYEHGGISFRGLGRALMVNLRAGGATVQGGSTITQQVAEDVVLGHSRALSQKVREWILAYRLERELSKDEILGLYMNNIFLGHGRYGVDEAARFYFGKRASQLDGAESALIAGIIASPERYSPRRAPELALKRRAYVLGQMLAKGFITPDYHRELMLAPLSLPPVPEEPSSLAPEAVRVARQRLREVGKGGFDVETTIVPRLQIAAREAVRAGLSAYADRHELWPPFTASKVRAWGKPLRGAPRAHRIYVGTVQSTHDDSGLVMVQVGEVLGQLKLAEETRYNPKQLAPSQFTRPGAVLRVRLLEKPEGAQPPRLRLELGPQAALAAVNVNTRAVVALVGSYEGSAGGFDRSTQARRQPGSAFKPFVYSAALHEREVSPATVLNVGRAGPGVKAEAPPYRIGVRAALAHSNNDAAVQLLELAGPTVVVDWAARLGIRSKLAPDLSLALGAYEVAPLEMANAYGTFASGGLYREPHLISAIYTQAHEPIGAPAEPEPERVLSPAEAYLMTSLMRSVVEDGTGKQAQSLKRPIAAKTGTSNDEKDAWFVGYSTELSVAVWVGYDDTLPLGAGEGGTRAAGPIFVHFMQAAHQGRPALSFARPPGVVSVPIDRETGLLPWPGQKDAQSEVFLEGTEPVQHALERSQAQQSEAPGPAAVLPGAPVVEGEPATAGVL